MTVWNGFLIVVLIISILIMYWTNDRIWKRVRQSGQPNRAINPRAYLAGLRGFEIVVLAAAAIIAAYALRMLSFVAQTDLGINAAYWLLAVVFVVPIVVAFFVPMFARIAIFAMYAYIAYSIVAAAIGQKMTAGAVVGLSLVCAVPAAILGAAIWRAWAVRRRAI